MAYVYAGKHVRIDLTTGEQRVESIAEEDVRKYYLGSGYAAMLMAREMDPNLPPLDPRSPIYIFNGLMSGTFAPTGCRSSWCGRSPLTGIWNESNMGGHWGAELRFAGLDGLVITGRAEKPVYLYVHDGAVEIRDASAMWGMETYDAYDAMLAETDPKARAAVIGPAGENLVHFANIMQGGHEHSRAAGRGGMGAVLGSKNVKGIVCRGRDKPVYADPTGFRDRVREDNAFIKEHSMPMSNFGTAGGVIGSEGKGDLPLRNWRDGSWPEGAKKISGPAIHEQMWVKHTFCYACPIGCGKLIEVREGPHTGVRGEGPEYETLAGFGANLLNDDLAAVAALNDRCARYGLDTISASSVITFAFEAFERGLIGVEEVGGAALEWGDASGAFRLLDLIAAREDAGAYLADGVRVAAAHLGRGAEAFASHVKGMELPYHDPRAFIPMAATYATGVRGACHLESLAYWRGYGIEYPGWQEGPHDRLASPGAAAVAIDFQNYFGTYNPLGLCKFIGKTGLPPDDVARFVGVATGWDITGDELLTTGARIFNLKRLINNRYGIGREDDTLPDRILTHPRPSGGAEGNLPDLPLILEEYYAGRGWLPDGRPSPETLARLGL
jgi:aldehyde:ferredoxin oxidoreductase